MNLAALRTILTASILAMLTACGGAPALEATNASAATTVASTPVDSPLATLPAQAGAAGQPVPDCQPENCAGLRIIDGNAEAWRLDAMRRNAS
jgi:hypothetical protein